MSFNIKRSLLLITNALLPGIGPLFYGVTNFSIFGIISGLALILAFFFVILLVINGDFHQYETYNNIFLAIFHKFNGHKLERSLWTIVMIILLSTIVLYGYIVYISYKITLSLNKSVSTLANNNSKADKEKCAKSIQTNK